MAAAATAPSFPRFIKMPATAPAAAQAERRRAAAPPKHKAVVVLGATGSGKSRLAIDLALRFDGEVINSDKMQVYAGLDVTTNKVTPDECAGVPHHLLGVAHPDDEFTAADFRREAVSAAARAAERGRVPIVAGGSNSYVEALVAAAAFDHCFLWVDAHFPVLRDLVVRRVDGMLRRGLVDEVAAAFDPHRTDYTRGVWRAIGVPELDAYLRARGGVDDGPERERMLLARAVEEIKYNTSRLASRQSDKIQSLTHMWHVRRLDATEVILKRGRAADDAWQRLVAEPSIHAVSAFLMEDDQQDQYAMVGNAPVFAAAVAG
jgi:adenylate dimethylallyltransferase (cytokinin synthase)